MEGESGDFMGYLVRTHFLERYFLSRVLQITTHKGAWQCGTSSICKLRLRRGFQFPAVHLYYLIEQAGIRSKYSTIVHLRKLLTTYLFDEHLSIFVRRWIVKKWAITRTKIKLTDEQR